MVRASPICLRLFWQLTRLAASRAFCTAGTRKPKSRAMTAVTTSNSISVRANRLGDRLRRMALPLGETPGHLRLKEGVDRNDPCPLAGIGLSQVPTGQVVVRSTGQEDPRWIDPVLPDDVVQGPQPVFHFGGS